MAEGYIFGVFELGITVDTLRDGFIVGVFEEAVEISFGCDIAQVGY